MDFADKNRAFIEKLQKLPELQKKIILWAVVAIIALPMMFFWVRGTINNFSKISGTVKFPEIKITSGLPLSDVAQPATPASK
jgi:hypothetical protein